MYPCISTVLQRVYIQVRPIYLHCVGYELAFQYIVYSVSCITLFGVFDPRSGILFYTGFTCIFLYVLSRLYLWFTACSKDWKFQIKLDRMMMFTDGNCTREHTLLESVYPGLWTILILSLSLAVTATSDGVCCFFFCLFIGLWMRKEITLQSV